MSERKIATVDVALRERCQCRAALRDDVVDEYAELYRTKVALPPLDVFDVSGDLVLVDGFHRYAAARKAEIKWLRVHVVGKGTEDDAVEVALAANQAHGLKRTNADKRRAVELALVHPTVGKLSDREISSRCGVGVDLVGEVRSQVSESDSCAPKRRKGKDGKWYPAHPAKKRESEPRPPSGPPPEKSGTVARPPVTARPIPAQPPWTAAADLAREARLLLEKSGRELGVNVSQETGQLRAVEHRMRSNVAVVHAECGGKGCRYCGDRGWLPAGSADTEASALKEPGARERRVALESDPRVLAFRAEQARREAAE